MGLTALPKSSCRKLNGKMVEMTSRDLNNAVENFFSSGGGQYAEVGPKVDQNKIAALFAKYADKGTGNIEADGIGRFCEDLGVDAMDVVTLVISHQMGAQTMGVYTKEEWVKGFRAMGAESIQGLKGKLHELRKKLDS